MSASTANPDHQADSDGSTGLEQPQRGSPALAFWTITRTWLTAPDRGNARWLIAGLLLLTFAQVGIQIRFNLWNRDFFNALESRDGAAFRSQIILSLSHVRSHCQPRNLRHKVAPDQC